MIIKVISFWEIYKVVTFCIKLRTSCNPYRTCPELLCSQCACRSVYIINICIMVIFVFVSTNRSC
nr:MAG TPA: hypothetical protein [Bacteriophage sp.]